MLHESSMACLLEGVLAACPSLMLPLQLVLLHKGAHGHMHNPIEQSEAEIRWRTWQKWTFFRSGPERAAGD